jgi:hypothetical protein
MAGPGFETESGEMCLEAPGIQILLNLKEITGLCLKLKRSKITHLEGWMPMLATCQTMQIFILNDILKEYMKGPDIWLNEKEFLLKA